MVEAVNFKEDERVTLRFIHPTTLEESHMWAECNPMTGHWLRHEVVGDKDGWYYSDKTGVKSLIKAILEKNGSLGLKAEVTVSPRGRY